MPSGYHHLIAEERTRIECYGQLGWSQSAIAAQVGQHRSTISRELIGSYLAFEQAVGTGVRQFGTGPFLVRLMGEDVPVATVPRCFWARYSNPELQGRNADRERGKSVRFRRCRGENPADPRSIDPNRGIPPVPLSKD